MANRKRIKKSVVPRLEIPKARRNRIETSQKIIEALENLLAERELRGITVNQVAERASVSKVLIYRYFGGLNGLLASYLKTGKLIPLLSPAEHLQQPHEDNASSEWYKKLVHTYRYFRQFEPAYQLLKATVIEDNGMAKVVSNAYDEELTRFVDDLAVIKGVDFRAVSAIMLGAMSYLTVLSKNNRTMIGIDLNSEEGWHRIEEAVRLLYLSLDQFISHSLEASLKVTDSDFLPAIGKQNGDF